MVHRTVVKASLRSTLRNRDDAELFERYVFKVHQLTKAAFLLAKFIFLKECDRSLFGLLERPLKQEFFVECLLALNQPRTLPSLQCKERTRYYRQILRVYVPEFREVYTPAQSLETIKNAQQTCLYQGRTMISSYLNNYQYHLEDHIRGGMNAFFNSKRGTTRDRKKSTSAKNFILYGKQLDIECSTMQLDIEMFNDEELLFISKLWSITSHQINDAGNNVAYCIKKAPENQVCVAIMMSRLFQESEMRTFVSCPLRTTFIPGFVQIDTKIMCMQFLNISESNLTKLKVFKKKGKFWNRLFKLNFRPFKAKKAKGLTFEGSIYTDGYSISVLLQSAPTKANKRRVSTAFDQNAAEFEYVEDLGADKLQGMLSNTVYVDPNRRDLMYCMGHNSKAKKDGLTYRYTSQSRRKDTGQKWARKKMERTTPRSIKQTNSSLPEQSDTSNSYDYYLRIISVHHSTLCTNYERKVYRRIAFQVHKKTQAADKHFLKTLTSKYGTDAVFIFGNYSMPNVRFHEPVPNLKLKRLLAKNGHKVYLIDEFKTSSFCPTCGSKAAPYLRIANPRIYRRASRPEVLCHGLLKCYGCSRLWNRDQLAVMNFRIIVTSLTTHGGRPALFSRAA